MNEVSLIDPLTDSRWEDFVQKHPYALIYHSTGWKRVLEKSFKHMKGHYIILTDSHGKNIEAALPVYIVDSWLLGKRLVSLPFATICDPLVLDVAELERLLEMLIDFYRKSKASSLEIKSLKSHRVIEGIKSHRLTVLKQFKHHYLYLSPDPEEVRKKFRQKSVRSAIRKAERGDLIFNDDNTESELRNFYDLYVRTRKELGLPPQPFKFFKNIWTEFANKNIFKILLASYKGKPVAGLAYFKFKKRISTEFAGWVRGYKDLNANSLLYWSAIKQGCEEGYEIFDFGRTAYENKGLMNFKQHWGTIEEDIHSFYYPDNIIPALEDTFSNKKKEIIQCVLREKTPDFIAKLVGDFCYRHLG